MNAQSGLQVGINLFSFVLTFDPKQMETNLNQLLEDEGGGSGATTGVGGRDICRETSVGKSGERERETHKGMVRVTFYKRKGRRTWRKTALSMEYDDVSKVHSSPLIFPQRISWRKKEKVIAPVFSKSNHRFLPPIPLPTESYLRIDVVETQHRNIG